MRELDPGPIRDPFRTLATTYPDISAYPMSDFRVEWGPIFYRGRLDGTARLLCIGQDPASMKPYCDAFLLVKPDGAGNGKQNAFVERSD
jgi:hypothetical protein